MYFTPTPKVAMKLAIEILLLAKGGILVDGFNQRALAWS
jgi:hypothetical protein